MENRGDTVQMGGLGGIAFFVVWKRNHYYISKLYGKILTEMNNADWEMRGK